MRRTQALARMELRKWELDSWDALVEESIASSPPSFLREMDQRCPRGNRPTYTTVAKFQASTRDPRDKSSASSAWHPHFSHPHSSQSESGETSEKGCRKEKEKQRCLKHERANVNVPNVASTGPRQGRTETPQKTSDCLGNLRVDEANMDGAPEATLK